MAHSKLTIVGHDSRWKAQSLLLIIEERHCILCGAVHSVPGDLFVRLTQQKPYKEWLVRRRMVEFDGVLPHEHRSVTTLIDACTKCFEGDPADQLSLFGNPEPIYIQPPSVRAKQKLRLERLRAAQDKRAPDPGPVLTLADF